MTYLSEESKVLYQSKDGKMEKIFDALEWLAALTSHVPNKGEQMVRYYGHYSNPSRGLRQENPLEDQIETFLYTFQRVTSGKISYLLGGAKHLEH